MKKESKTMSFTISIGNWEWLKNRSTLESIQLGSEVSMSEIINRAIMTEHLRIDKKIKNETNTTK